MFRFGAEWMDRVVVVEKQASEGVGWVKSALSPSSSLYQRKHLQRVAQSLPRILAMP